MIWGQLSLQDSNSPLMDELVWFHDFAMLPLVLISSYVLCIIYSLLSTKSSTQQAYEHHQLESIWTLMPIIILVTLAYPSLHLLYILDETHSPSMTIKVIGHQWYWSYQYSDFMNLEFDSYMLPDDDLSNGNVRLMEVDNRMVIPMMLETRVLVTAADVMHAWTIPSMGVKADAVPGRLNQLSLFPYRPGVFYGQCSEICGANHSFMPIAVEAITTSSFKNWAIKMYNENIES
uniref:Cytochrome c oxidase subunit 2 n=1 Tax=Ramisyllis multicaudata TaxID=1166726 RepID=A0A0K0YD65_RAMMU|nr:cytochrome c oxidase subunit II [Ramisyllis multicaudata]AKS48914.1 cytochrome c oxidase subunit II [Ramisyllis multicaudata]